MVHFSTGITPTYSQLGTFIIEGRGTDFEPGHKDSEVGTHSDKLSGDAWTLLMTCDLKFGLKVCLSHKCVFLIAL